MHRQPHRLAERQPVGGAQGDVDGDALGEVHLDRHLQRQVAGRQLDLAHVGHRHARRGVDLQPDPDRHRQVVAQRQRQRAAFGGQGVGPAGVDDRHRVEQVVDRRADHGQPLLRQPVAGVRRHGLAQRTQHVLAQRRGVLRAGQPGPRRRSSAPTVRPHSLPVVAAMPDVTASSKRARGLAGTCSGSGRESCCGTACGLGDHRGQRPRCGQTRADRGGHRGQDRRRVVGLQAPLHRRHQDLAARLGLRREGAPQQGAQRVLSARHRWSRVAPERPARHPDTTGVHGSVPTPASAAPTVGSNGAATTSGV